MIKMSQSALVKLDTVKSLFKRLPFRYELVWTAGLTVEINYFLLRSVEGAPSADHLSQRDLIDVHKSFSAGAFHPWQRSWRFIC